MLIHSGIVGGFREQPNALPCKFSQRLSRWKELWEPRKSESAAPSFIDWWKPKTSLRGNGGRWLWAGECCDFSFQFSSGLGPRGHLTDTVENNPPSPPHHHHYPHPTSHCFIFIGAQWEHKQEGQREEWSNSSGWGAVQRGAVYTHVCLLEISTTHTKAEVLRSSQTTSKTWSVSHLESCISLEKQ